MASRPCVSPAGVYRLFNRACCQSTRSAISFWMVIPACIVISARTSAAQAQQDFLAANVDSTISPGADFFQYANGAWLKRNPIPDNSASWGVANLVDEIIALRLKRISEDAAARRAPRGSSEQLVGDFWFTGMDSATINRQGLTPLRPDLDRIDRIHSTRDLLDVVALFHTRDNFIFWFSARPMFYARVEQDERNSDRWILSLLQSGITMRGRDAYVTTDPRGEKAREALREYLFRTFVRLKGDTGKARRSADAVFRLEAQLANGFDEDDHYRKIGVTDLSRLAPTIDWNRYLQRFGATGVDSVNMRNPRFYRALDSLLRTTPLDNWKDYLRYWLIKDNSPYLDDATFGESWAYDAAKTGAAHPRPRWRRVLEVEKNRWLGEPLARLFEREYFPANVRARHKAMADSLRNAFRRRIERLDWMSDRTKQRALLKLAHLKITIGVPERTIDVSTMPLRRDSYVLNMRRASTWYHDRDMSLLNQPVDRRASDLRPGFSEAWYNQTNNEVSFGPVEAMLVPEVPDEAIDDAVLYGASFLGHEMSHAFDSNGRHFDADGNEIDWWTARDDSTFQRRAQLLVDEYNEFMPLDGMHVNGERSLAENMADLVGLRVALDAFKRTEQFRRNERIAGFTPLQRFFLAYAYGRANNESESYLAGRLRNGAYAPSRERVNGVLANIPEFYEAFGVKPGDPMYRPDSVHVKIW